MIALCSQTNTLKGLPSHCTGNNIKHYSQYDCACPSGNLHPYCATNVRDNIDSIKIKEISLASDKFEIDINCKIGRFNSFFINISKRDYRRFSLLNSWMYPCCKFCFYVKQERQLNPVFVRTFCEHDPTACSLLVFFYLYNSTRRKRKGRR